MSPHHRWLILAASVVKRHSAEDSRLQVVAPLALTVVVLDLP